MAKLSVLQARHSGDGWKSLVATIQIVRRVSGYYQVLKTHSMAPWNFD